LSKISAYTKNIGRRRVDIINSGNEEREAELEIIGFLFLRADERQIFR
jgi:hypothetical protein